MPATAKRPPRRKTSPQQSEVEKTLARYESLVDQIRGYTDLIREYREELTDAAREVAATKAAYEDAKQRQKDIREVIDGAEASLVHYLMPADGGDILPLFDRMEPADDETHGANSQAWRQEPIAALRLSLLASKSLTTAEIMLVGQLQDRILGDPARWWEKVEGLTYEIAIAVQDKLADFINDRSTE